MNWEDIANSGPATRAGWPSTNIESEVARGEAMYTSMMDILEPTLPDGSCKADPLRIKYLLSKGDVLSIQDATELLTCHPEYFVATRKITVQKTEVIEDIQDYVFRSDGVYLKSRKDIGSMVILREAFVGLMCLNHLRLRIPNFASIVGLWIGQKAIGYPLVNGEGYGSIITTDPSMTTEWLAYEEIRGISLGEYVATHGSTGLENILWQIANALKIAYTDSKFYHNDLHYDNIVLTPKNHQYFYTRDGKVEHCSVNLVAVMIDYGRSSCTYKGVQYSKWWEIEDEEDPATELYTPSVIYPVRDMLFLLGSLLRGSDNPVASEYLSFCEKLVTMDDFETLLDMLAPSVEEYIFPAIEVTPHKLPTQPTLEDRIRDFEVAKTLSLDSYSNIISYSSSLLSLLESGGHVRPNELKRCLDVLDSLDYKTQIAYDIYMSLLAYEA